MGKNPDFKNTDSETIQAFRNRLVETAESQEDLIRLLESLRRSEVNYKQILDLLPEAVFELDLELNYTYVNKKAVELTGYSREFFLKSSKAYDIMVAEDKDKMISDFTRVISGQEPQKDVYSIITKDGRKLDLIVHVGAISSNGLIIGVRGVATDITEQTAAGKQLKREKELLRLLLETANSIIICLDSGANILVFNDECERITGYKREEVMGKCWPEIFVPREYHWPSEYTFAQWIKLHPRDRYECPLITKSGEIRNIFWSNSAILADDDNDSIALAVGFDVTDLKNARAALHESEYKYRQLLEQSNDAIYLIADGKFTFVNDRFVEMFGYSRNELLSQNFNYMTLVSEESKPLITKRLEMIERGVTPSSRYEYIGLKKDGSEIYLDVSLSYINLKDKQIVQGIYRDITQKKKVEEKLMTALSDLNQIFKAATPMIVIDEDCTILKINPTYQKLFKVRESEVIGQKCRDLYYSEMCDDQYCPIKKLLAGADSYEYENKTILADGTEIISLVTALPYRDIEGNIQGIVESYIDITDRKRAERALRESEERYRAVWENSPLAICLTNADGIYLYVNPAYCSLYGYTEQELVGRNFADMIVPAGREKTPPEEYRGKFEKGIPLPMGEAEFIKKDGTRIWVQYKSDYIRIDGKPALKVTMNIDITDRKTAERDLLESRLQFKAQFKVSPIPTYTWRKDGEDFILMDYNDAAARITDGKIADFVGIKMTKLYADEPEIMEDIRRCYNNKMTFTKEYLYHYRSTQRDRYLDVGLAYAPPDLVLVHTEDITQRRANKIRTLARLNLLKNLRNAETIDESLELGCKAIAEAGLFKRSVLTLHNEKREIINLGQYGLNRKIVEQARGAPAPDSKIMEKMLQECYRISNSYFIPIDSGLELNKQARHIGQDEAPEAGELAWKEGDELFVPIIDDRGSTIGWLSVDTPVDGKRPTKDIIVNLEEIVAITVKKVQALQHLFKLNAERDKLEEKNITMKELLTFIQREKHSYRKRISDTVEQVLLPALEKTRRPDGRIDEEYFKMMEENLRELSATMGKEVPVYSKLSAREAEICQMIKVGATSKSIANKLNITVGTVQKHREKIRKKLGISSKNINLTTYLKNL